MTLSEIFVARLTLEMAKQNMSGYQLAELADINRSTVSRILGGRTEAVSLETVQKIAKALDVRPSQLVDA